MSQEKPISGGLENSPAGGREAAELPAADNGGYWAGDVAGEAMTTSESSHAAHEIGHSEGR
jgi:hypothetical protein